MPKSLITNSLTYTAVYRTVVIFLHRAKGGESPRFTFCMLDMYAEQQPNFTMSCEAHYGR